MRHIKNHRSNLAHVRNVSHVEELADATTSGVKDLVAKGTEAVRDTLDAFPDSKDIARTTKKVMKQVNMAGTKFNKKYLSRFTKQVSSTVREYPVTSAAVGLSLVWLLIRARRQA